MTWSDAGVSTAVSVAPQSGTGDSDEGAIAKAVIGSGVLAAAHGGVPHPAHVFEAGVWAVGGIVVAGILAFIGHGYRCIGCDRPR
ncbi:hypothetical protein [Amycolatopsis sp. WQ 127309]|uniref:hypothetical protein n=1 Tax=Amycolatopsis sp. WQ 127309 TaxID=2932773 RepID=UPI001FF5DB80|nr:hypothetical protein [Amycolatopsis sp. WQ 127309]UOZ03174.1 hypothetical protein MUY22_30470 [Amycolatopsis sp. WQ 127309]